MKAIILALLMAATGLRAAATDVNVVNSFVPASQYGNWAVSVTNMPTQLGATQTGSWNVGQAGVWYMGQYGSWTVNLASGGVVGISGTVNAVFPGAVTITAGVSPLAVSVTSFPAGGIVISNTASTLPVSATSTISTNSGSLKGEMAMSSTFFYDSSGNQLRRWATGILGDNVVAQTHPGVLGHTVYNPAMTSATAGNLTRMQGDYWGNLYVTSRPGVPMPVSITNGVSVTCSNCVASSTGVTVTNTASNAVQVAGSITNTVNVAQSGTWNLATSGNVSINAGTATIGKVVVLDNTGNSLAGSTIDTNLAGSITGMRAGAVASLGYAKDQATGASFPLASIQGDFVASVVAGSGIYDLRTISKMYGWDPAASTGFTWPVVTVYKNPLGLDQKHKMAVGIFSSDGDPISDLNALQVAGSITNTVAISGSIVNTVAVDVQANSVGLATELTLANRATEATLSNIFSNMASLGQETTLQAITTRLDLPLFVAGTVTNTANNAVQVAGSVTNTVGIKNSLNASAIQIMNYLGVTDTSGVSAIQYASITFTATGGAATGVTIASAVSGKTIVVVSYTLSTDTAARLTLHHQGSSATRSNTVSNIIGGGLFPANGGESKDGVWKPGLAQNQPVCLDVSVAVTGLECSVAFVTY